MIKSIEFKLEQSKLEYPYINALSFLTDKCENLNKRKCIPKICVLGEELQCTT